MKERPEPIDEKYVREILAAARKRKPMTEGEFALFTHADVNGGYQAEADEAARRYFEDLPPTIVRTASGYVLPVNHHTRNRGS